MMNPKREKYFLCGDYRRAIRFPDYKYQLFNKETEKYLGNELRSQGHDVVILNFPIYKNGGGIRDGGVDYIERNAMVLVELIQQINRMKQGQEQLVIIGPSMGGLISRYALAYMEKNNIPHHTCLWVSLDAPHQGANIPIGLQHAMRWFKMNDHITPITPINSPAARQMLVSHHLAGWNNFTTGAPGYFDRFMRSIKELGHPKNLRKVTVSNGSMLGTQTNKPQESFMQGFGRFALGAFKIKSGVSFTPESGLSTVFWVKRKLGWFSLKGDYYKTISDATIGSYDNAPGGVFDFHTALGSSAKGTLYLINQKMRIGYGFWAKTLSLFLQTTGIFSGRLEHAQFFSFIPSKSSIDFKGSNRQLKEDISKRNMVCSEETPFDSYYMPEKNQGHIQLTRGNANFILNEINKKPQDPTYRLDANSIQGQGLLCDGSVQIFSVPNCKKDPGITLQASPDLKVLAQGSGSITVQAGGQNGKSWIKAFDRNGHLLGQKDIWVGKPRFELDLYSESELFYSIQEII